MVQEKCDYCSGGRFRRLPYYYMFKGDRIYGVRCEACGLITVSPMPGKDDLSSLYGEDYFQGDYHCGHREGAYEDESFSEEHTRILDGFKALKPAGMMLEVGAAGGKFLVKAREQGYGVMGVEVSPEACSIARSLGLEHFCGELDDARFPDGNFDLVYLGDVLEHLPKPFSTLREIYRITAPGGVVGLSCPTNIGLLSSRVGLSVYALLGKERVAPLPPYHLYEFTPASLKALLTGAGFKVAAVKADIIPPWRIRLRGSLMEKAMKAALHWPNYLITRSTGLMGDRVTIFASKP